jgi:hypothetical protein
MAACSAESKKASKLKNIGVFAEHKRKHRVSELTASTFAFRAQGVSVATHVLADVPNRERRFKAKNSPKISD